jgi:hypothetical protein
VESGGEDGDAIHLAFDQDGVVEFLDPFLGKIEIEQDLALGVDRGLGGVEIFRSGFFIGREGAPGEGDDFASVARDREHNPVAEFGVHRELRVAGCELRGNAPIALSGRFLLLPGEKAAVAQEVFAELGFQAVAEKEARIRRVSDAELGDHGVIEAAPGQVFAGTGAFGTLEAFLKEGDGAFVDVEQLSAQEVPVHRVQKRSLEVYLHQDLVLVCVLRVPRSF